MNFLLNEPSTSAAYVEHVTESRPQRKEIEKETAAKPDPTQIYFDPVLLHATALREFCRNTSRCEESTRIPREDPDRRAPNPSETSVNELPALADDQCVEVTKTAISQIALYVGFENVGDEEIDVLYHVFNEHLTEMMQFYACMEQRRRDKQPCAFKSNVPQQVLLSYGIRHLGILRDYYDVQVRGVRNRLLKEAEACVENRIGRSSRASNSQSLSEKAQDSPNFISNQRPESAVLCAPSIDPLQSQSKETNNRREDTRELPKKRKTTSSPPSESAPSARLGSQL